MRVAFFSPLPPAKSGIADYSAAVLEHLDKSVEVETFTAKPAAFDAPRFDICVYQLATIRITVSSTRRPWNTPAWW